MVNTYHFFFLESFLAFYSNQKIYRLLVSLFSEPEVLLFVLIFVEWEELADVVEIDSVLVEQVFGVTHGLEGPDSGRVVAPGLNE
jgi:hypothetical protein